MNFVKNLAFFTVLIAVLSFVLVLPVFAESNFQPQNLIGEWWGEWKFRTFGGKVFLTIDKVGGKKVSGEIQMSNSKIPAEKFTEGLLEENVLKIKTKLRYIELTITDKEMNGFVETTIGPTVLRSELEHLARVK